MKDINNILDEIKVENVDLINEVEFTILKNNVFSTIKKNKKLRILKYSIWSISTAAVFVLVVYAYNFSLKNNIDFSELNSNEIKTYLLEENDNILFEEIKLNNDETNRNVILDYIEEEDIENYIINN